MSVLKNISVVQVNVMDWAKAKKFYGETLGLPIAYDGGEEVGWCEFGTYPQTTLAINLWRESTPPQREGGATPVFGVDDANQAVAELRKKGVKCDDVTTIPDMVAYANVYDPEGNRFQIAQTLAPNPS